MDIEEREEIFSSCNFNNCNHYKYRSQTDSAAVDMINYTSSDPSNFKSAHMNINIDMNIKLCMSIKRGRSIQNYIFAFVYSNESIVYNTPSTHHLTILILAQAF